MHWEEVKEDAVKRKLAKILKKKNHWNLNHKRSLLEF